MGSSRRARSTPRHHGEAIRLTHRHQQQDGEGAPLSQPPDNPGGWHSHISSPSRRESSLGGYETRTSTLQSSHEALNCPSTECRERRCRRARVIFVKLEQLGPVAFGRLLIQDGNVRLLCSATQKRGETPHPKVYRALWSGFIFRRPSWDC